MKKEFIAGDTLRKGMTLANTKALLDRNRDASQAYNVAMLKKVLWVGILVSSIAFLMGFFRADMHESQHGYLMCTIIFAIMMAVFRGGLRQRYPLVGLYMFFVIFFLLVLYLSCFVFRARYAATALTFFCIAPLVFVDSPVRVDLFVSAFYIVLTVTSFLTKELSRASVDAVNCAISMILGIAIGRVMLWDRLENFEANRLLKLERETDVLTTLYNRRKLFDEIAAVESGSAERPDGVLMMDIDYFKRFNDTYGHAAGDLCLQAFGALLKNEQSFDVKFYRYGGEEFVGFLYHCGEADIAGMAERIRAAAAAMELEPCAVTVSVGGVFCGDPSKLNYEHWIDCADKAAYAAKAKGRNTVQMYDAGMSG